MEASMAGRVETLLANKKIELPKAAAPVANYVPVVIAGNLAFVSGQVTVWNGEFKFVGKLGQEFDVAQGQQAARLCGLNVIAQLKAALGGDLDRVKRCVKLGVFVNSTDGFTDQPKVANGVSDLIVEVFGEAGKHARFAVGSNVLPLNVAVEVDAVFEIA
jgi:enamine deaminase RidA (YjgF/YER057c/UK114 family)